jgi:diphosphomevalonate decarboxylase
MASGTATAQAHPNIAFIKYWGNRDEMLRLPSNGSISMNLGDLFTKTSVSFDNSNQEDSLTIDGKIAEPTQTARVSQFLDLVRQMANRSQFARVESENNFPSGAGIASSSSAFAALALAASAAAGLNLDEETLSRLARRGSGSACRSVPGGFVEWSAGDKDESSFAKTIAQPEYWDLVDCIAVVNEEHKGVGSTQGHALASTSPLQAARVQSSSDRLDICRRAIIARDFEALAQIVEMDSDMMHAVMMTSRPPLHYWLPASVAIMQGVRAWRGTGLPACYTVDAGPNIHVLTIADSANKVVRQLTQIPGVLRVLKSTPGGPASLSM